MNLNNLSWNDTCCADLLQWTEVKTKNEEWLRIKKKRLGGYLVTRFGKNLMPLNVETEMSAEEVEQELQI